MPWIWDLRWGLEFNSNMLVRYYFFLKYVTSEGAVSQCFILSTTLYCSTPSKFVCQQLCWVITNSVKYILHALNKGKTIDVIVVCKSSVIYWLLSESRWFFWQLCIKKDNKTFCESSWINDLLWGNECLKALDTFGNQIIY